MKRRARIGSEQSGVSLILVLATLTIFGLLVPVLGQFGSVNGISAYVVKGQRFDRYAADSAMQGAIAWAQEAPTAGRANVPCPEVGTGALNAGSPSYERSATVRCQGFKGSGVPQETPTMPKYAVLALGTAETGIRANGAGQMATSGAWWSNSAPGSINIANGVDLDASQDFVGGVGTCTGLVAAPAMCAPDHPGNAEPEPSGGSWTPAVDSITDVPIRDPFPAGTEPCDAVNDGVLELEPGFYWDIDGLNDVSDGCGAQNDQAVTIRFEPGAYYFDFDFFDRDNTQPNSTLWSVSGPVTLVSGEGTNGLGNCQPGVELAFGSTSHLRISAPASTDICPLSGPGQKMSIVGLTDGDTPQVGSEANTALDAVGEFNPAFSWPNPAVPVTPATLRDADCLNAPGPCPSGSTVSGNLTGRRTAARVRMRLLDPVPDGVRLDGFELTIVHVEQQDQNNDLASLRVRLEGLPPGINCDLEDDVPTNFSDWQSNTFACTNDGNRPYFSTNDLSVVYELENGNRLDAATGIGLDQVELTANFTRPAVREESGCVTNTTTVPQCDLVEVDQQQGGGSVFVHGTVFAPRATVHLRGGGVERTGFTRGVVVRSIVFTNPGDAPDFAPVSLPGGGSYTDRLVTFEAALEGSDDNPTILSARVRFCDAKPEEGSHEDDGCEGPEVTPPRIVAWEPKR